MSVLVFAVAWLVAFMAGALAAALGFYYGLRSAYGTRRKEAKHGRMR